MTFSSFHFISGSANTQSTQISDSNLVAFSQNKSQTSLREGPVNKCSVTKWTVKVVSVYNNEGLH